MAKPSKLPRPMREARRRVERAFRTAERVLIGLDDAAPQAAALELEEQLGLLHADDASGRDGLRRRLDELRNAFADETDRRRYVQKHGACEVTLTRTSTGERIYRLVATTFPGHENYIYVVVGERGALLWDVGSGEVSRPDVLEAFEVITRAYHDPVALQTLKAVVVSHAHIDHFGDAAFFKRESGAPLMVHELDARVLTQFEERMVVASKDMGIFFARAGLSSEERVNLERMYLGSKDFFRSVEVDRRLRHGERVLGFEVMHTPGHCPGHLCMRVGDALLVADQVLNPITPNLSPASITAFNGLESYINALLRLRNLEGVEYVLPAHANPIPSLGARIDEILEHHQERCAKVLDTCTTPRTMAEVSQFLYGGQEGYGAILALAESGAHVEYLHQHGRLRIANLETVAAERDPVIQYVTAK